jgi:hypothetical protein
MHLRRPPKTGSYSTRSEIRSLAAGAEEDGEDDGEEEELEELEVHKEKSEEREAEGRAGESGP